jgi:Raf kinase inhibitor-like YbhB/YbcL family protein
MSHDAAHHSMTTTRLQLLLAAGGLLATTVPMAALAAQDSTKSFTVSSPAFKDGQSIPEEFTAYGKGKSIPLNWSRLPSGTRSIAVVMDDPDAKTPQPFVHWVIYNIAADAKGLDAGLPTNPRLDSPKGALQGSNGTKATGYFGPRPPQGDPPHHYQIKVYALTQVLKIDPGVDEEALLKAMQGHVLGQGHLMGTVQKK